MPIFARPSLKRIASSAAKAAGARIGVPCRLSALRLSPRSDDCAPLHARRDRPPPGTRSLSSSAPSGYANPTKTPASSVEPVGHQSRNLIEDGSRLLEKGDLEGALEKYEESIAMAPSSTGYYNLGIALYQLKRIPEAIEAWQESLADGPSADVHTNLASAYILSKPPEPFKALEHLKKAVELDPTDGEICFNLGAVNEANDHLADALAEYTRARQLGVERAEQNIRNVGAKLLRKRLEEEEREQAAKKK
ncbi:hypothetical protein PTTG_02846 [Puccinia triticina 1-1 BBBD Race 1]|uniref:Uncharacterized protein n=1 Tax=Puccinia triticina (isolate 1-1 / race 1 (BBBD)) TaxID=630390 RepID=A0A180GK66_PUCT1|nr:hypothetical protein PTTG_02846 [Puccinia triticina 1-1 BBBD Race 1]